MRTLCRTLKKPDDAPYNTQTLRTLSLVLSGITNTSQKRTFPTREYSSQLATGLVTACLPAATHLCLLILVFVIRCNRTFSCFNDCWHATQPQRATRVDSEEAPVAETTRFGHLVVSLCGTIFVRVLSIFRGVPRQAGAPPCHGLGRAVPRPGPRRRGCGGVQRVLRALPPHVRRHRRRGTVGRVASGSFFCPHFLTAQHSRNTY